MHGRVDALLRGHRGLLLGAVIVLVALMAGPAVAGASTDYWVEACGPSAVDDFSFFSSDSANLGGSDSACGASNPVGLSVSDNASGAPERLDAGVLGAFGAGRRNDSVALLHRRKLHHLRRRVDRRLAGRQRQWPHAGPRSGRWPRLQLERQRDLQHLERRVSWLRPGCRRRAAEPNRACDRLRGLPLHR